MMKRCSSRSWLPGSRLTTKPIVSRPQRSSTDTTKNVRIARARSSRRKRQPQRIAPTATSNEKMGKRARSCVAPDPSKILPVNSHSMTFLPPYELNQKVPTLNWVRSAHLLSTSNGTITQDAAERAADPDRHGPADASQDLPGLEQHPDAETDDREVPGEEVAGDREPEEEGRDRVPLALGDRAPGEHEREWEEPHAPELRPDPVAPPDVAEVLVPVARDRGDQRREDRGRRRGPAIEAEQPDRPVDAERPEGEEQVRRSTRPSVRRRRPWRTRPR